MEARERLSQHEQAERHRLITDGATVTCIEALDENRTSEIESAVVALLREHDRADWIDEVVTKRSEHDEAAEIDWDRLQKLVDDDPETGPLGEFVATLREWYQRPYRSLLRMRLRRVATSSPASPATSGCSSEPSEKTTCPYREAFRSLDADRENFHSVPTLSQKSLLTDWTGETAYVQHTFCKYLDENAVEPTDLPERLRSYLRRAPKTDVDARFDPTAIEVYTVGIGAMVSRLLEVVDSVGPTRHTSTPRATDERSEKLESK